MIEHWQTPGAEQLSGLFHYCDDRTLSWYGFAYAVFSYAVEAGLLSSEPDLAPVPSSGYPQPAPRPKWSVLDTNRIATAFDIHPVSFNQSLKAVIDEVGARA